MMWYSVGLAICVASLVLYTTVVVVGMSGGRGLSSCSEGQDPRGIGWVALMGAVVSQWVGIALVFFALGRWPTHWVDLVVVSGAGIGLCALLFALSARGAVLRAPLSVVAIVCTVFVFMVAHLKVAASPFSLWAPVFRASLVVVMVGAFGASAIAIRRLLRVRSDAAGMGLMGLGLMAAAIGAGWGAPSDAPRPFVVYAVDTPDVPEEIELDLEVRDTETVYARRILCKADLPWLTEFWRVCKWALWIAFAVALIQIFVPSIFYRVLVVFSMGSAVLLVLGLFGGLIYALVLSPGVNVSAVEVGRWVQTAWLANVEPAISVQGSRFVYGGEHVFHLASMAPTWLVLLGAAPVFLVGVSYRFRGLTSPVRNPDAEPEAEALGVGEYVFMGLAVLGLSTCLFSGAMMANAWWGWMDVYDPRALLCFVSWCLGILYFFVQAHWEDNQVAPSLLALGLGVLCVAFLVGPELGWILPSSYPP